MQARKDLYIMEEKKADLPGQQETAPAAGGDKAKTVFQQWQAEGLAPADMYKRVSDLFDSDPEGAMEMFGFDFMDTVDYFTHYWY